MVCADAATGATFALAPAIALVADLVGWDCGIGYYRSRMDRNAALTAILIIDDDGFLRSVIRRILRGDGHQVIEALDGAEGLKMFETCRPDLVITDIRMSPVDGVQVLLAAKKYNPMMAVIMMTGHLTMASDAAEAKKLGADDYICKPFQLEDFGRRVDIALNCREQLRMQRMAGVTGAIQGLSRV